MKERFTLPERASAAYHAAEVLVQRLRVLALEDTDASKAEQERGRAVVFLAVEGFLAALEELDPAND